MIRGLIKIHKTDDPIRPIINWKEAPAYNLAKKKLARKPLNVHSITIHFLCQELYSVNERPERYSI